MATRKSPPALRKFRRTASARNHMPIGTPYLSGIAAADNMSASPMQRHARACLCSPFLGVQGLAPETRGMERGRRLTAPSPAERPKRLHGLRFHAAGSTPPHPLAPKSLPKHTTGLRSDARWSDPNVFMAYASMPQAKIHHARSAEVSPNKHTQPAHHPTR